MTPWPKPGGPWPVRYVLESGSGATRVHLRSDQFTGMTADEVSHLLSAHGVTADVTLGDDLPDVGPGRRVVRADLTETTFARTVPLTRSFEEAS